MTEPAWWSAADSLLLEMDNLDRYLEGFRGLEVRRDGDRQSLRFHWFDDPNVYELSGRLPTGQDVERAPGVWHCDILFGLGEELMTNLLMRAIKTRDGAVLRIDLDGDEAPGRDETFHIGAVLNDGGHLARVGLHVTVALSARARGELVQWWFSYVNARRLGPAVGQLVVVRGATATEAVIAQVELTDQTPEAEGFELVFTAIHQAARSGVHRLYSPRTFTAIEPFGFADVDGAEGLAVYDVTTQDLNWPAALMPRPG